MVESNTRTLFLFPVSLVYTVGDHGFALNKHFFGFMDLIKDVCDGSSRQKLNKGHATLF